MLHLAIIMSIIYTIAYFHSFTCDICTIVVLLRFHHFSLSLVCVCVLNIYEQTIVKGAKRMHYAGVTCTKT
jgi:hypothetical protein